jgi:hypothetical protein
VCERRADKPTGFEAPGRMVADHDRPAIGCEGAEHATQDRRLSRSVRPCEPKSLPKGNSEVEIVNDVSTREAPAQPSGRDALRRC